MATISESLAIAVQHHDAGRLEAAEQIGRQILAIDPEHADALHLVGLVSSRLGRQEVAAEFIGRAIALKGNEATFHSNLAAVLKAQGKLDEAVEACHRALELKPDYAAAHYNLGAALQALGKPDEAIACFSRALKLSPGYAEAHNNLGITFLAQGKLEEAIACFRETLEQRPNYAVAYYNLGTALQAQGRLEEAIACFRRTVELQSDLREAHYNLGNAFQAQGKLDEAVASYRQTLILKPDNAAAYNNLGTVLQTQGKLDEAVACLRRALLLKPDDARTYSNLGTAFKAQGKLDEAVASFQRALELNPDWDVGHYNLGTALQAQEKLDEASDSFRRALELKPDLAEAYNSLGTIFNAQRKIDEAVTSYRQALELKPDFSVAHSNLLLTLQYHAGTTLAELSAAHFEYDRLHAAPLRAAWRPHENVRDPERRLRIGFVSRDFGRHPVGFFLIRGLENFDRGVCEVVCYSDRQNKDDLTARFESAAALWRDVSAWSDPKLAEQIRADRIDILFDLAGHTAKNRLLVFARKPAPIQVTWAGYVGTTGLMAMDYILADRYQIPVGSEAHYRERVLRMPDGYVCYDPPAYAPGVSSLPALTQGLVTFGSFNNPAKLTSPVVEVWSKILARLPQSRLVLKYRGMNNASIASTLVSEFASRGIDRGRVECLGWSPHATLLAEYRRIDVALDPFPYNGGLTTCEALWMGVPVITWPGETFASRHSLSYLSNMGLTETIAGDMGEYVEVGVSLANDLPRLTALRAGLRENMAASPLCDGKRFAENLMRILRDVWRQWHSKPVE